MSKSKSVFVLVHQSQDDTDILGAFSTETKAKKALRLSQDGNDYVEFDLDFLYDMDVPAKEIR